jgi:acetyl esterase/lipase
MNFTGIVLRSFILRFMKITYCSCCFTSFEYNAQNYAAKSPVYVNPMQNAFYMPIPDPADDTTITYTYKQTGELKILADVYPAAGEKRPVVVWIHGGALIMGNRKGVPDWLLEACRKNKYVLVSIDYRLAPETQLPLIIEDLEDAFRWIYKEGPKLFHADPGRIAVVGASAGGYLTLTAGFRVKPRPQVLVSLYGYGDLVGPWYSEPSPHPRHHKSNLSREEAFKQVSGKAISDSRERKGDGYAFYQFCRQQGLWPNAVSGWDPKKEPKKFFPYMAVKHVTAQYPPTLLIHGDNDTDVPFEQSEMMAGEFRKHHVEHRLVRVKGGEHGLAGVDQKLIDQTYADAATFLEKHLGH